MTEKLAIHNFTQHTDFDLAMLQNQIHKLHLKTIDYADFYLENNQSEFWAIEDGLVKSTSYSHDKGIGIRAVSGDKTAFAHADDLNQKSIEKTLALTRSISRLGQNKNLSVKSVKHDLPTDAMHATASVSSTQSATRQSPLIKPIYSSANPLLSLTSEQKVDLLKKVDQAARQADHRVKQVHASIAGNYQEVLILATDHTLATDIRPLVRFNISITVEEKDKREQSSLGMGGRFDYSQLSEQACLELTKKAVDQALLALHARPAPAGEMPVVLGNGWPGVLLHEAVGHGLEGDANRKGTSKYSNMMGKKVASPLCTIVDHGHLPDRRGSLHCDDEGTPTQENLLIHKGKLVAYMQDKLNARLMDSKTTGNGRRESYAHLPMPRMTNTYMLAGEDQLEDMISSIHKGIYAVNFAGGQVDTTSGQFVFSASHAYLIEKGKITTPIKGATLIGNGPETMQRVSMVGHDLELDTGVGTCGKDGQSVPVGVGQPSMKIDKMTVGGTE